MNLSASEKEERVFAALRQVIDPEIGCNIVDLGLIYGIALLGETVAVRMTLTTPGCPMGESMAEGVQATLLALEGIRSVEVEIVWDPPWHPARMTEAGRAGVEGR